LLDFARSRNVTKIIVGKTALPWWRRLLFGTVVDILLESSGDIDVYVIHGAPEEKSPPRPPIQPAPVDWPKYLWTAVVVGICCLLGWISHALGLTDANIVMVFLLGVTYVAYSFGRGPAIAGAIASVLAFDFFFVPPYLKITVHDAQYIVTFAIMLVIGIVISALTARIKEQLGAAQQLESRTAALFRLTKQLSEIAGPEFLIQTAGQQLGEIFGGEVVIYTRAATGPITLRFGQNTIAAKHEINPVVAQ